MIGEFLIRSTNYIAHTYNSAIAANVLLLNEIGLDPGIDHCSAISLLERIKSESGGKKQIKSFVSFCGGLPAPDLLQGDLDRHGYPSAGPLLYKFSWSPRGVLTAALNGARYRLGGEEVVVPGVGIDAPSSNSTSTGGELLKNGFPEVDFSGGVVHDERLKAMTGMLEGLPNRNSVPYADMYGLQSQDMRTLLRGTLRFVVSILVMLCTLSFISYFLQLQRLFLPPLLLPPDGDDANLSVDPL